MRRVPAAGFRRAPWSLLFDPPNCRGHRRRNFDTGRPSSYRYEPSIQLRLESVANAHTAADLCVRPWVSNRADLESRGRREQEINTPSAFPDNPWIRRGSRLFATVAALPMRRCESKFLNHRVESRVSQTMVQYQKFFIENLHLVSRRSFFQSLSGTMCISNSRSVIFHDCFCRVTPPRFFDARYPRAIPSIWLSAEQSLRERDALSISAGRTTDATKHDMRLRQCELLSGYKNFHERRRDKNKKPGASRAS